MASVEEGVSLIRSGEAEGSAAADQGDRSCEQLLHVQLDRFRAPGLGYRLQAEDHRRRGLRVGVEEHHGVALLS